MVDTRRRAGKNKEHAAASGRGSDGSRTVFTLSEEETVELGRSVAKGFQGGELILLEGDLGLGKTAFARGIAEALGVAPADVSSPSFTLVQEYRGGRLPVFHVDLYRIDDIGDEMGTLGIEEILTAGGIVIVEWGEKLPAHLRRGGIEVRFHDLGEGSRRIEVLPDPKNPPRRSADA